MTQIKVSCPKKRSGTEKKKRERKKKKKKKGKKRETNWFTTNEREQSMQMPDKC